MSNKKNNKNSKSHSKENNKSNNSKNDGWVGDPEQQPAEGSSISGSTTTYRNSNEKYDDEALNR